MLKGFRELEVRVNRPGLTIRTKRGYIAAEPPKPDPHPPPAATVALQGILPKVDLPLTVTAAPFAIAGSSDALVAIGIGVREPPSTSQRMEQLAVQARAFTPAGDQRAGVVHTVDTIIPASSRRDAQFDVVVQLRLKPGVYALRCSADSTALGVTGSVYADVEIPDFAKAPLSVSGVLLQVTPPRPAVFGASDILAGLPIAPTTERTFTAAHHVNAFLRVYQGASTRAVPVSLALRVLDATGATVYDQASTLATRCSPRHAVRT